MQKLSKRLQAAADFVTHGSRIADVGTDHGFLPIYLIQSGRCPRAVAMDIREGPLERAREHILAAGLHEVIQIRRSDGMQELSEGEADSVAIAGMGGLTVIHILEEAQEKLAGFRELILEPQSDPAKVRRYLREHNLCIDRENLVYETGKYYPVLHISTGKTAQEQGLRETRQVHKLLSEKLADEERVCGLLDQYGARMIYEKHPVLRQMLERDEKRELRILYELEKGMAQTGVKQQNADAARKRQKEVKQRLEEIVELRKFVESHIFLKRTGEN